LYRLTNSSKMNITQENNTLIYVLLVSILVFAVVLCYLVYRLIKSGKAKKRVEEQFDLLELKVNNLQLETLESRLNPHLFKNILNSIQSHAYQTYFALDKLANVLDYILYESQKKG
jgi:3-deoxy-D-manno-octulosonic-acid transferase